MNGLTIIVNPFARAGKRSDSVRMATTTPPPAAEPAPAAESGKIRFRALVRAYGCQRAEQVGPEHRVIIAPNPPLDLPPTARWAASWIVRYRASTQGTTSSHR